MELWIFLLGILILPCKCIGKGICNVGVYTPGVKLGEIYDLTDQFNGQNAKCRKTLYFPGAVSLTVTIYDIKLPVVKRVEYIGINTGQRQTTISSQFFISSGECDGADQNSVSIQGKSVVKLNNTEYVCLQYLPPNGLDQSGPLYGDYGPHPLKIDLQVEVTAAVCNISDMHLSVENLTNVCSMICTKEKGNYQQCQVTSPQKTTFIAYTEHVTIGTRNIKSTSKAATSIPTQQTVQSNQRSSVHTTTSKETEISAHPKPLPESSITSVHPNTDMFLKSSEHPKDMSTEFNYNKLSSIIQPTKQTSPFGIDHIGSTNQDHKPTKTDHVLRTSTPTPNSRSSNSDSELKTLLHTISKTTYPTVHTMMTLKNAENVQITRTMTRLTISTGDLYGFTSLNTNTLTPQPEIKSEMNVYSTSEKANIHHHGFTATKTSDVTHAASNSITVPNLIITSTITMDDTNNLLIGLYTTSGLAFFLFILLIILCCCSCSKGRHPTMLSYSTEDIANMSVEGVHVCGQWKRNWIMKPKFGSNYSLQRHPKLSYISASSDNDLVHNPRDGRLSRLQSCGSQTSDNLHDHTHNSMQENEESVYDNIGVVIPQTHTESVRSDTQTQTDFDQKQNKKETSTSLHSSNSSQSDQTEIINENMEMDGCNKTEIHINVEEQEENQKLPIKRKLSSMYSKVDNKHV